MKNRIMAAFAAAALGACTLAGAPAFAQAGSPHASPHGPMMGGSPHGGPFMGGKPGAKDPAVDKLVAQAQKLDKELKAKPKDAKLKAQTADAWYKAGFAQEYSKANLAPRDRYRTALLYYRNALAMNPKHDKAIKEKNQIETIYKQMGMPIPK